jgi:hypothetical protein
MASAGPRQARPAPSLVNDLEQALEAFRSAYTRTVGDHEHFRERVKNLGKEIAALSQEVIDFNKSKE